MDEVYAAFGRRFAAYVIDYLVVVVVFLLASAVLRESSLAASTSLWLLIFWLYKSLFESSKLQATLGKRLLFIQVTDLRGERIGFLRAAGRFLGFLLSTLTFGVGFLMAAFTQHRQGLHDLLAGTLVVRDGHPPAEIAAAPPARGGNGSVVVILVTLVGIALLGILAAIAIPAYQQYSIRAQIDAGLELARPFEDPLAQALVNGGDVNSISIQSLGVSSATSGRYVASLAVDHGAIVITYGDRGNLAIQGRRLLLSPVRVSAIAVGWACGYHEVGGAPLDNRALRSAVTDIPEKFLPQTCRK